MYIFLTKRRTLFGVALLAIVGIALFVALVAFTEILAGGVEYPGARVVSDHSIYGLVPQPYLRRDTSYRTTDQFPIVYNWYSVRLDLGPEARAQSNCIFLEGSKTWLIFYRYASVTICDTSSGRMMFVQRSMGVR